MPFVALGNFSSGANQVESSPDGVTWTLRASPTDPSGGFALTFALSTFVALCFDAGGSTQIAMTSPDGAAWTGYAIPQPNSEFVAVCFSAPLGLFVAIDDATFGGAVVVTSPDGTVWTQTATVVTGGNSFQSICAGPAGPSALVAVGSGAMVATSPDGVTWTPQAVPGPVRDWSAVCFANGQFVALASSGLNHQAMTSPDGVTWTPQVTPVTVPRVSWLGIAYGAGLYVAVGSPNSPPTPVQPAVMTSPDGITWTRQVAPVVVVDTGLHSVVWSGTEFVAVGYSSGGGQNVLTSPDGIAWTLQTSQIPDTVQVVAFGLGIPPLIPSCNSPASGLLLQPYTHTFTAAGGTPPYTFAISAGALPPGLSLDPLTGIASGAPTAYGVFSFTLQVTDSAAVVATVACSITIQAYVAGVEVILRGVKRRPDTCLEPVGEIEEPPHVPRTF